MLDIESDGAMTYISLSVSDTYSSTASTTSASSSLLVATEPFISLGVTKLGFRVMFKLRSSGMVIVNDFLKLLLRLPCRPKGESLP